MASLTVNLPLPPDVPISLKGDRDNPLKLEMDVKGNDEQPLNVKLSADIGGTTPITISPISLALQGGDVNPAATALLHAAEEATRTALQDAIRAAKKKYQIALADAKNENTRNLELIDIAFATDSSSAHRINRNELRDSATGRNDSNNSPIHNKEEALRAAKSIYEKAINDAGNICDVAIATANTIYNSVIAEANTTYAKTVATPSPLVAKVDLSLDKLPKGKLKLGGLDIGFYLFSWRIFSIKVQGEAELKDGA